MAKARFITAVGTPLTQDDRLHVDGYAKHLDDQAAAGIDSILAAGTMGLMPMQSDQTWRDLLAKTVELGKGRFELLVGATDISTARALDRVQYVNSLDGIDGTVIMVPGYFKYSEAQYVDYFTALADASRYPVYLYDLQPLTGVHLSVGTVCKLAEHPNIAGIKLSANVPEAARLKLNLDGAPFRLIVAEPVISDMLFRAGYDEHLDGIYVFCPHWATALAAAAQRDAWDEAALWQAKLTRVKELFLNYPFDKVFTLLMNDRGVPGKFTPRPFSPADGALAEEIRSLPIVKEILADATVKA